MKVIDVNGRTAVGFKLERRAGEFVAVFITRENYKAKYVGEIRSGHPPTSKLRSLSYFPGSDFNTRQFIKASKMLEAAIYAQETGIVSYNSTDQDRSPGPAKTYGL